MKPLTLSEAAHYLDVRNFQNFVDNGRGPKFHINSKGKKAFHLADLEVWKANPLQRRG